MQDSLFLDSGYFLNRTLPGGDQADFAPRFKKPVLMPGADAALERHVVLDPPHDVTPGRPTSCRPSFPGWTST